MCFFNSTPAPAALPPIPAPPPVIDNTNANDPAAKQAASDLAKKAAAAKGLSSTIATSPLGDTSPVSTQANTLYGKS